MTNNQSQITNIKTLVLILGPTGVGKTELSLGVAQRYGSPVINCDSRQVYRDIPIGTAAPTAEELTRATHFFVGTRALEEDYNAGQYERDALALIEQLFQTHEVLVMSGGSMLYADAVCNGLDDLPAVPAEIRAEVTEKGQMANGEGLKWLQSEVQRLDPVYWEQVDQHNPARLRHCVEMCLTTGKPYSSLLTKSRQPGQTCVSRQRPFRIVKIGLDRPREELYDRINRRVLQMIDDGLVDEARRVYPKRHLNSLQTVGYKELFGYFDGEYDLDRAIELIQQNTRHYAKRQLTWFRRDKAIHWLNANDNYEKNYSIIDTLLSTDGM